MNAIFILPDGATFQASIDDSASTHTKYAIINYYVGDSPVTTAYNVADQTGALVDVPAFNKIKSFVLMLGSLRYRFTTKRIYPSASRYEIKLKDTAANIEVVFYPLSSYDDPSVSRPVGKEYSYQSGFGSTGGSGYWIMWLILIILLAVCSIMMLKTGGSEMAHIKNIYVPR